MRNTWIAVSVSVVFMTTVAPGVSLERAESQGAPVVFEVASVKPNTESNTGVSGGCHGAPTSVFSPSNAPVIPPGRCVINAARLSHLMSMAYDVPIPRVKGGPEWVWGAPRFNITAKAESATATYAELTRMLQALLEDRFKLRIHRETQPVSGYALLVGPNGPKLKESRSAQEPSLLTHGAAINKFDAIDRKNLDLNSVTGRKITIGQLAQALSRLPGDVPVVDQTGLNGLYDISLSWEPDEDLARVVQEQLGLRMNRQDVPTELILIDSAERPTEN